MRAGQKHAKYECVRCGRYRTSRYFNLSDRSATGRSARCKDCVYTREGRSGEREKEYEVTRYKARKAAGLCAGCGARPSMVGRVMSSTCIRCGVRPTTARKTACSVCLLKVSKDARLALIEFLGGICACCGFTDKRFLTVDHINNDGNKERRGRESYYRHLQQGRNHDLQALCWNCNMAKQANRGTCPHQIFAEGYDWVIRKAA